MVSVKEPAGTVHLLPYKIFTFLHAKYIHCLSGPPNISYYTQTQAQVQHLVYIRFGYCSSVLFVSICELKRQAIPHYTANIYQWFSAKGWLLYTLSFKYWVYHKVYSGFSQHRRTQTNFLANHKSNGSQSLIHSISEIELSSCCQFIDNGIVLLPQNVFPQYLDLLSGSWFWFLTWFFFFFVKKLCLHLNIFSAWFQSTEILESKS